MNNESISIICISVCVVIIVGSIVSCTMHINEIQGKTIQACYASHGTNCDQAANGVHN